MVLRRAFEERPVHGRQFFGRHDIICQIRPIVGIKSHAIAKTDSTTAQKQIAPSHGLRPEIVRTARARNEIGTNGAEIRLWNIRKKRPVTDKARCRDVSADADRCREARVVHRSTGYVRGVDARETGAVGRNARDADRGRETCVVHRSTGYVRGVDARETGAVGHDVRCQDVARERRGLPHDGIRRHRCRRNRAEIRRRCGDGIGAEAPWDAGVVARRDERQRLRRDVKLICRRHTSRRDNLIGDATYAPSTDVTSL